MDRHCGICHAKTTNKDFCNKCLNKRDEIRVEIKKRLKQKKEKELKL